MALHAQQFHFRQPVMAEGIMNGFNHSAMLMARNSMGLGALPNNVRPRPETVAAAAAGDPIAIFCTQHSVDYSAENALRALPVELQCRVLNEGPLRAQNPSAVLMSRVRKAQLSQADYMRRP